MPMEMENTSGKRLTLGDQVRSNTRIYIHTQNNQVKQAMVFHKANAKISFDCKALVIHKDKSDKNPVLLFC